MNFHTLFLILRIILFGLIENSIENSVPMNFLFPSFLDACFLSNCPVWGKCHCIK